MGLVEYRVVLWNDSQKSYGDLWNEGNGYPNRYYTKWQPTGNTIFTLGWPIFEPGNYRITVYAKRVGVASNKAALIGMNCDSYKESVAFTVKPKITLLDKEGKTYGSSDANKLETYKGDIKVTANNIVLSNAKVEGDLYISGDNAVIKNVSATGKIVVDPGKDGSTTLEAVIAKNIEILSGGPNSIHIKNVKAETMNVSSSTPVRVEADGDTEIVSTSATGYVIFDRKSGTYGTITIIKGSNGVPVIEFRGDIKDKVVVETTATIKTSENSKISNLVIATKNGTDTVKLEGKFAKVEINSEAKAEVAANTKIENIVANANAEIDLNKTAVVDKVDKGSNTVVVGGEGQVEPSPPPVSGGSTDDGGGWYPPVDTTIKVSAITFTTKTMTLIAGGATEIITANVSPANATNKNVTWSSSNTAVATVDNTGKVTAISDGTATITATTEDGSKTASCEVSVISDGTDITSKFTDTKFKEVVYTLIKKSSMLPILFSDVKSIPSVNVDSKGIISLSGIEYFTGLTTLECSRNQLTTLDVSKNTGLTTLYCVTNQLKTLDVSKNTVLSILRCDDNKLTTLDVSKNTVLNDLGCNYNKLTTLDVSKNTGLTTLECNENKLTILDVSMNTVLNSLDCSNNELTTFIAINHYWYDSSYKPQYTDSTRSNTTDSLVITISVSAIDNTAGTAQVGSVLTAGTLTPTFAKVSYQWTICATSGGTYTNIAGATLDTYTPAAGDVGKYIKVVATGTDGYAGTVTSACVGAVAVVPGAAVTGLTGVLQLGETTTATAATTEAGAGNWTSRVPAVATVDGSTGVVTALTAGTTTIAYTASTSGNFNSKAITVYAAATTANPTIGVVQVGKADVTPTGFTAAGAGQTITWLSSDTAKATVDAATGVITAVAAGDTIISYKVVETGTGKIVAKGELAITVQAAPVEASAVATNGAVTITLAAKPTAADTSTILYYKAVVTVS